MLKYLVPASAIVVLLVVDWLAFHDLFEPHTARDYLTLVGSLLAFASLALSFFRAKARPQRALSR